MSQIVSENVVVVKGDFPAICDSSFDINSDIAFFALVTGSNGSGKTTLLKAISGNSQIARGSLFIDGTEAKKRPLEIKKITTYVGHSFSHLDHFKVVEHLELNKKLDEIAHGNFVENKYKLMSVDEALDFCQLTLRKNVYISDLSAGQKRRLHIACAFMRNIDIVLIDEPHAALDSKSKDVFDGLFESQFKDGRSLLIATHDPKRLEHIATDFLNIENGVVSHSKEAFKR